MLMAQKVFLLFIYMHTLKMPLPLLLLQLQLKLRAAEMLVLFWLIGRTALNWPEKGWKGNRWS